MTRTEPRGSRAPSLREPGRRRVSAGIGCAHRFLPAPPTRRLCPDRAIPALPFASVVTGAPPESTAATSRTARGRLPREVAPPGR
ncbi:hypothetical protein ACIQ6Y_16530 [Streptomyces sp. NPDC096205]|uniref:hypothetical protein n=1 Tax=Streptomyces sp. NPDC096205 TaxID=3366081 RepID=UPI0037F4CCED